jgi:hypothetical protein
VINDRKHNSNQFRKYSMEENTKQAPEKISKEVSNTDLSERRDIRNFNRTIEGKKIYSATKQKKTVGRKSTFNIFKRI